MYEGGLLRLITGCIYSALITLGMLSAVASSGTYLDGCSESQGVVVLNVNKSFSISISNFVSTSPAESTQCSILLQAQHIHSKFLVQFEHFAFQRILKSSLACDDSFQIRRDSSLRTVNETPFFSSHGIVLKDSGMFYTSGRCIVLTIISELWSVVTDAVKPHITLTAILHEPFCEPGVHRRCSNGDCISSSLFCDGLLNCASSEDETSCSVNVSSPLSPENTDYSDISDNVATKREFYTWIILLTVVLFMALLIVWMFRRHPQPSQSYDVRRARYLHRYETLISSKLLMLTLLWNNFCISPVLAASPTFSQSALPSIDSAVSYVTRDPGSLGDSKPQDSSSSNYVNKLDYISIAVICSIIALCFLICIIVGWRRKKHHMTPEASMESPSITDGESRTVEVRGERAQREPVRTGEELRGDSPPPTYSIIERQTSFTSYVSQTSSQFEIPPDYDDSWDSADGGHTNGQRGTRAGSRSSHGSAVPGSTVVSMAPSGSRSSTRRSESARGRPHAKTRTYRTTSDTGRTRRLRTSSRPATVSEDEDVSHSEVVSEISGLTSAAVLEDITEQNTAPGRESLAQPLLSSGGASRDSRAEPATHVVSIETGSQSHKLTLV